MTAAEVLEEAEDDMDAELAELFAKNETATAETTMRTLPWFSVTTTGLLVLLVHWGFRDRRYNGMPKEDSQRPQTVQSLIVARTKDALQNLSGAPEHSFGVRVSLQLKVEFA